MENRKSRKEWVKTFAIIFLAVLLVLTFFSNTIMNYSLPEVAAQYCYSGSITNKVRGSGYVEADAPYSVVWKESRKVSEVNVRIGDEVEKGDIIYLLEEGDSEEVKQAEEKLASLEKAYQREIINSQISSSITSDVEKNGVADTDEIQKMLDSAKKKVTNAEKTIDNIDTEITILNNKITVWSESTDNSVAERVARDEAAASMAYWDDMKTYYQSIGDNEKYLEAATNYNAAAGSYDYYNSIINNQLASWRYEITVWNVKKAEAQSTLQDAQDNVNKLISDINTKIGLKDKLDEIEAQKALVESLRKDQGSAVIEAPVSGTIISLSRNAGETIANGETVATIQMRGKGYSLTMSVTQDQAKLISIGDEAEISNSWWYTDAHARVTAIRPDPNNQRGGKLVIFEVTGDVASGQQLSLVVGKKTANYDVIVPNNAIHEDNKGKFIYRVEAKSTPLGTRYTAIRVDVTVLAGDEKESAISGDLDSWEYIITTSAKPIEDGQLIRLKD